MTKDELVVVNMKDFENPGFLDIGIMASCPSAAQEHYSAYAEKLEGAGVRRYFPLLALFKGHELHGDCGIVPSEFERVPFPIENGRIRGSAMHEALGDILEGEGHGLGKIRLIVEFSEKPLYHDVIDRLSEAYNIKKVNA